MSFSLLLRREIRNDKGKGGDSRGSGVEDAAAADADEADDDDDDDDGGEGEVMRIKSHQILSQKVATCRPAASNAKSVRRS